jgi:serine/threonine-protein kinase RsbW
VTDLPTAVFAEVPATPEFVQVLRNIAAGVAARLDMPIDQIEEVRLAVTEAASLLLDEVEAASLRMSIGRDAEALEVRLSADGRADP